jgi:hypothetical protein
MKKIFILILASLFCLPTLSSHAEESSFGKAEMYCNSKTSQLIIVSTDDLPYFSYPLPHKRIIDWGSLLIESKEKNVHDMPYREGSKTAFYECGKFKISFKAGFWNRDPMGEDGVYAFAIIQIYKGSKALTQPVILTPCDWIPGFYGHDELFVYSKDAAVAVSVESDNRKKQIKITYTRLSDQDGDKPQKETTYIAD